LKTLSNLTCLKLTFLLGLLLVCSSLQAQVFPRGNSIALTDVKRFDAYVEVLGWDGVELDRGEFRLNAQEIFEQGMEDAGAPRRVASSNYLVCRVQAKQEKRTVAYTSSIQYWSMTPIGVNALLWENGAIGMASSREFDEALVASQCVDLFTEEWQKWNPRNS
jgi:hypothetical protein